MKDLRTTVTRLFIDYPDVVAYVQGMVFAFSVAAFAIGIVAGLSVLTWVSGVILLATVVYTIIDIIRDYKTDKNS